MVLHDTGKNVASFSCRNTNIYNSNNRVIISINDHRCNLLFIIVFYLLYNIRHCSGYRQMRTIFSVLHQITYFYVAIC